MKQLTGPTSPITDQRDAFDVLEGYPRRSENIGAALAPFVPDVYSEGAIGWVGHAFSVNELYDEETWELTGEAVIYVPDDLAAEHPDGTVVELPDGRFVTIDLSGAVDVQTEASLGEAMAMHQFTGFGGVAVHVRSVRVALVMDALGGAQLIFPTGEDPVTVAETLDDVVAALAPELVLGLVRLSGEDGEVAVNPRYVLHVHSLLAGGTRVAISGGRTLDVTETVGDVLLALGS